MTFGPRRGLASTTWRRAPLIRVLIAAITLVLWTAAYAWADSGGGSAAPPPKTVSPARGDPFTGRGMWIWYVSQSASGNPSSLLTTARSYGISVAIVKAGDGISAWPQFNPQLVSTLHAGGVKVCAWQYVYGDHPVYEAWVGAAAVRAGADCLLIDAESEYEGKYVQAQRYVKTLRQLIGASFPVGLAAFPYVDYHPAFPYSVFLGPGGAQYNVPQMYWPDIGTSVDALYAHTYEYNELYQRPIEVLGEVAGDPPPAQIVQFRQMSRPYGAKLVSWWDWQSASASDWQAIAQPFSDPQGLSPSTSFPLLSTASAAGISTGDLVVWAQEHLLEAGEPVVVDGQFGPVTQSAVAQFQAAHGIPVSGMIDQPTWHALLRYPRPTVTWSSQQGTTIASAAAIASRIVVGRRRLRLAVPWSASLPAKAYEIPKDLGAGGSPR